VLRLLSVAAGLPLIELRRHAAGIRPGLTSGPDGAPTGVTAVLRNAGASLVSFRNPAASDRKPRLIAGEQAGSSQDIPGCRVLGGPGSDERGRAPLPVRPSRDLHGYGAQSAESGWALAILGGHGAGHAGTSCRPAGAAFSPSAPAAV